MPAIDYHGIRARIKKILEEDTRLIDLGLKPTAVRIEPEIAPSAGMIPWIGIYMESRSAPADQPP